MLRKVPLITSDDSSFTFKKEKCGSGYQVVFPPSSPGFTSLSNIVTRFRIKETLMFPSFDTMASVAFWSIWSSASEDCPPAAMAVIVGRVSSSQDSSPLWASSTLTLFPASVGKLSSSQVVSDSPSLCSAASWSSGIVLGIFLGRSTIGECCVGVCPQHSHRRLPWVSYSSHSQTWYWPLSTPLLSFPIFEDIYMIT